MTQELIGALTEAVGNRRKPKCVRQKRRMIPKHKDLVQPRRLYYSKQMAIIKRMYGTVGCTARKAGLSETSKEFQISKQTLWSFLNKYESRNGSFPWPSYTNTKTKLLTEHEKYLTEYSTLYDWRFLTMAQRCAKIYQDFGIRCSRPTLAALYHSNGIVNRKAAYRIASRGDDAAVNLQQQYFVKTLIQELADGTNIVYFDETTVNFWMKNQRSWFRPEKPITFVLAESRKQGVTIFGSICSQSSEFIY